MSASSTVRALMPNDIAAMKGTAKIACLTAYTTPMAKIVDQHCDLILVGDSVGMVLHGLPSTVGVTMEMMVLHGRAVMRGAARALVVVDMPFGSYEESPAQAFRNARQLIAETGCAAVKLEGGVHMAETIAFLVKRGVPVMAHIGLTPQSVNTLGGYKVQGRGADAERLKADARAVAEAGLDEERARGILAGDEYATQVREREAFYRDQDIHSVPAIIIDGRHLIPGAQAADVFERVLRKLASKA